MSEPMALPARVGVAAGLHDLVGALDEARAPRVVGEAIAELDAAAVAAATGIARLTSEIAIAEQRLAEARGRAAALSEEAEAALAFWRDDLAEHAIRCQLALEEQSLFIERSLVALSMRHAQMAAQATMIEVRRHALETDLAAYERARQHHAGVDYTT